MLTFLHAADIHLDSPLRRLERYAGAPLAAVRQATRRAFENLVQLALENAVAFVLIAGDIYDGDWKDYNTGLFFASQMARLREAGIAVYLVSGNHDAASQITRHLRLPDNVHRFATHRPETVMREDLGVALHGQGFGARAVTRDLAAGYPRAVAGAYNIGLLHTCAGGREGHAPYAPCTLDGLRSKGYDYWALGHVHRWEVLSRDPWVVFAGNPQGRHIRESGPKGATQVTVDDTGRTTAAFQALDVIRWEHLIIAAEALERGEDLLDAIRRRLTAMQADAEGRPLIVRLEVTGATTLHDRLRADPERWTGEIRAAALDVGGGLWIEKIKLRTRSLAAPSAAVAGPLGELLAFLDAAPADPEVAAVLGGALGDLERRLPRELQSGEAAVRPEDPAWLRARLVEVRAFLQRRLSAGDGGR
jgi:DNA repair exonuclease SbcCD nuclease subunit